MSVLALILAAAGAAPSSPWVSTPIGYQLYALGVSGTSSSYVDGGYLSKCYAFNGPGIAWTGANNLYGGIPTDICGNGVYGAAGFFVLVGGYSGQSKCINASSASPWTTEASYNTAMGTSLINFICWGNSKFVSIGTGGVCATSPDGVTWTAQAGFATAFGTTNQPRRIIYALSLFIAIGDNGKCATSPDGITWTVRPNFTTAFGSGSALAIAASSTLVVAVGAGGICVTSTDGINWSVCAAFTTAIGSVDCGGIAYGAGEFVAAGTGGNCVKSTNGSTWTTVIGLTTIIGSGNTIVGLVYGNNSFVVAGSGNTVAATNRTP